MTDKDAKKEGKKFKVVFNGIKKEALAEGGNNYSKFINNLIRQYAGTALLKKEFKLEKIKQCQLFVIAGSAQPFTSEEIDVLRNYFEGGGNLLFIQGEGGDEKANTNLNDFLKEYSIAFHGDSVVRTAYYKLTGSEHDAIKFEAVRGFDGIKEATLNINGADIKVAVASGMKNAKVLLDQIKEGTSPYTFIEIMGCPGGCINGGGQPYVKPSMLPNEDVNILDTYREKRAQALYSEDERQALRQSHRNTQVQALYDNYLGEPNSHKAHELLHTHYNPNREKFPIKK